MDNMEDYFNNKKSFNYKWLEYRLIINKELYDEKVIDLKTFKKMEEFLLTRLKKG